MPKQTLHNRVMVQPIAHIDSKTATVRARTLRSGILQLQAIPRHTQKNGAYRKRSTAQSVANTFTRRNDLC